MKYEKSCGTITVKNGKVLLVTQVSNICGFPKGHIESGETEVEAAIRETKEETNVSVKVNDKYRYLTNFIVNGDINKDVVYFLAEVENDDELINQEEEIAKVEWVDIDKVRDALTFENLRELWDKALVDIKNNSFQTKKLAEKNLKVNLNDLKCIDRNINIDEYIKFRECVKKHMEHPEWLGDFSLETLITLLENDSKICIYYLENDPVCSMMFIPATIEDINDYELDLDYRLVADYGPMMVSPSYIGNNLQYQMLKEIDKYSIDKGYKYAVATAHPDNIYSINNLLKDDFTFTKQKVFTRGIRNIYFKNL